MNETVREIYIRVLKYNLKIICRADLEEGIVLSIPVPGSYSEPTFLLSSGQFDYYERIRKANESND